ncbi:MAG TPA: hypothetical protein VFI02_05580, partial [Armatimonadota bacterium]|nr:hypothetical protein [Armatimonadota bacterium]
TGLGTGEADRRNAYNANAANYGAGQADRQNASNQYGYGAGASEAARRQQYEEMRARFGVGV